MKDYLNSPIKEVITAFPEVGKILEEYHIGCVPCTVGSRGEGERRIESVQGTRQTSQNRKISPCAFHKRGIKLNCLRPHSGRIILPM